ncbi:MAG: hypothetical protein JWN07_3010 [Hyphomicrobiales bacterium]|nr:hypothetical protein [Hyphomicrobiales bacterium]
MKIGLGHVGCVRRWKALLDMFKAHEGETSGPLERAVVIAFFAVAALLLALPIIGVFTYVSRDYNEGWNGYQAVSLLTGKSLYPSPSDFATNNYPPVSFLIVAAATGLIKDPILAGRFVSLLSMLAVAWSVTIVARSLTGNRLLGFFAGAYVLAYAGVWFNAFTALNDPEWLSHAFQLAGLAVLFQHDLKTNSVRRISACALLMCLGAFVKHNSVVLPLATTLWLARYDRRAALVFAGVGLLASCVGLLISYLTFGSSIFVAVLGHARTFALSHALSQASLIAVSLVPYGVIAFAAWLVSPRNPAVTFVGVYWLAAAVLGSVARLGAGVDVNVYFDAGIAAALVAAVAVAVMAPAPPDHQRGRMIAALCLLLATPLIGGLWKAIDYQRSMRTVLASVDDGQKMISLIRNTPGPVACSDMAWCLWAGKEREVDFFNYGQKLSTGRVSPDLLLERLRQGYYQRIVADNEEAMARYFESGLIREALQLNYEVEHELVSQRVLKRRTPQP